MAYVVFGGLSGIAYPNQQWFALSLVLLAAIGLELAQLLTPDRHARVSDAVVKAAAGTVGLIVAVVIGPIVS